MVSISESDSTKYQGDLGMVFGGVGVFVSRFNSC